MFMKLTWIVSLIIPQLSVCEGHSNVGYGIHTYQCYQSVTCAQYVASVLACCGKCAFLHSLSMYISYQRQ